MSHSHVVQPGECIASIAELHGFPNGITLYEHPENEALRKLRPHAGLLAPGDIVMIPDARIKRSTAIVNQRHKFKVARQQITLRLSIFEEVCGPALEMPYELVVEGVAAPFKGKSGSDGHIEVRAPASASTAELKLFDPEGTAVLHIFHLRIGHLDPVDKPSGLRERLRRVNFECADEGDDLGPSTTEALRRFQEEHGLTRSGKPDEATRAKLVELVGI